MASKNSVTVTMTTKHHKKDSSSDEEQKRTPPPGYSAPPPGFNYNQPMSPPPPGFNYQPMQMQNPPQVQVVQPIVVVGAVGPGQSRIRCPSCLAEITTSISQSPSNTAWIAFWVMCIFGLWCGCCCIPFCMDSCKKVTHRCPSCQNIVGVYHP